jgi:exo-1,4-beta-D-glucosaminidase
VLWEDNDLTLLPGERREITATLEPGSLAGAKPVVTLEGWNVAPLTLR